MSEEKNNSPWIVIVTSTITLIGVIVTAYFGYLATQSKEPASEVDPTTVSDEDNAVLTVEYSLGDFTGANLVLGNPNSSEIFLVSDLTINWDYGRCLRIRPAEIGSPLIEHEYEMRLTKERGSELLDIREFKYGAGDVDSFSVDLIFPGTGVYKVWMEFKHKKIGQDKVELYQTPKKSIDICAE